MKHSFRLVVLICSMSALFATLALAALPARAQSTAAAVVLTRAHGDALAIWDATSTVTTLVSSKASSDQALRQIESEAFAVLVQKHKSLPADATTLTVQVIYQKTGAVSPTYQVATFSGIERLLTVKASIAEIAAHAADDQTQISAGKIPAGVTIVISGKLPPEFH